MIGVGIIGYGYWGPNLVTEFLRDPGLPVVSVSDLNRGPAGEGADALSDRRHHRRLSRSAAGSPHRRGRDRDAGLDPLRARRCRRCETGKHVLIEKPMTCDVEQAMRLVDEAELRRRILAVDHTFVYTQRGAQDSRPGRRAASSATSTTTTRCA